MAFRPKGKLDFKRIQSVLANTRVKEKDPALYQAIRDLISAAQINSEGLDNKISKEDEINLENQVSGELPVKHGGSYSGLYQPTFTVLSNLQPITSDVPFSYAVVGKTVNVSGMIYLDVTTALTSTALRISLPILSYLQFEYQVGGQACSPNASGDVAAIFGEINENCAVMSWIPPTNGTRNMYLQFMYQLIAINEDAGGSGGGGGSCGGGSGGCAFNPPSIPLFDGSGIVEAYALANPLELQNSCVGQGGNNDFLNGCIAALQAADSRFGGNGKRGNISDPSLDAISYYYGPGAPTLGDRCVYVVDIIVQQCGANPQPAWQNVTNCNGEGAWLPGPI